MYNHTLIYNERAGKGSILLKDTLTGHTVGWKQFGSCRICYREPKVTQSGLEADNVLNVHVRGDGTDKLHDDKKITLRCHRLDY